MLRTWQFLLRHTVLLVWTAMALLLDYSVLIFRMRFLEHSFSAAALDRIHRRNAIRYRDTAFKLKGGMIKIGQYISSRVDIMPKPWLEELAQLQDSVEAISFDYIHTTLGKELGRAPEEVFSFIDQQAVAAASFGQVHRATLRDGGQEVALKVQHAHIERTLEIDLWIMKLSTSLFGEFFPRIQIGLLYDEIAAALKRELRYDQEASHYARARHNLREMPDVVVPRVYEELCSHRLLVTEFIHGYKVNNREAMRAHDVDPTVVLTIVINAFVQQIYVDGFFQSDPHPGNLFMIPGQGPQGVQVGIIDFGQIKEIPQKIHRALRRSVWAVLMQDQELFLEMLIEIGIIQQSDAAATAVLIQDMSKFIETGAPSEVNSIDLNDIRRILEDFLHRIENVYIPEDLILYGRTIGLLHGLATDLDPNINVFEIVRPHLMRLMFKD
jgi:predicted unusual protein kinase regulating ubiquinone biosynthesis (AarF/ABC1/UbiB family)